MTEERWGPNTIRLWPSNKRKHFTRRRLVPANQEDRLRHELNCYLDNYFWDQRNVRQYTDVV